jgi:hypothetical protein
MYCNIEKTFTTTSKNICCNNENYVLQRQKKILQRRKTCSGHRGRRDRIMSRWARSVSRYVCRSTDEYHYRNSCEAVNTFAALR